MSDADTATRTTAKNGNGADPLEAFLQAGERLEARVRSLEAQVAALLAERDARDRQIARLQAILMQADDFARKWREVRGEYRPLCSEHDGPAPLPQPLPPDPAPERPAAVRRSAMGHIQRGPSPFKGKKRIRYTEEDVARWVRMWNNNCTLEDISEVSHATIQTIRRRLLDAGCDLDAPRVAGAADDDGDAGETA